MTVASTEIEASHLVLEIQIRIGTDERLSDTRASLGRRISEGRVFTLPEEPQKEKTISERVSIQVRLTAEAQKRRRRREEKGEPQGRPFCGIYDRGWWPWQG